MTRKKHIASRCIPLMIATMTLQSQAMLAEDGIRLQVKSGMVKFEANTNISAISVHGQSNAVDAELTLRKAGDSIAIENLRAVLDPKSLSTGMSIRDQHMRKRVFTTQNEQLPAIEFSSDKNTCPDLRQGQDVVCQVSGNLSLRGVTQPFSMTLKVRNDGKGYRATGDGVVKLNAFGIEAPCQLGVCVVNDVKLRLEFQAKENLGLRSGGLR